MAKQYDILIRMLMIGDSGVGKTCMLCRFTDEGFITPHISTIGIDFKMKNLVLDDKRIRVQIWDTAGQERYDTITTQYFRRAQGFMLVYDITSEASFLNVQKWMTMVSEHAGPDVDMFLVGNKSDAETLRTVSVEEGERFAKSYGMGFLETSAHNSSNINQHAGPDVDMFLVGNKSDAETLRTVSVEEGERFAKSYGMGFLETSAHNSSNINQAFVMLTKQIMRKRKKSIERQMENIRLYAREDSRADMEDQKQGKSACC